MADAVRSSFGSRSDFGGAFCNNRTQDLYYLQSGGSLRVTPIAFGSTWRDQHNGTFIEAYLALPTDLDGQRADVLTPERSAAAVRCRVLLRMAGNCM